MTGLTQKSPLCEFWVHTVKLGVSMSVYDMGIKFFPDKHQISFIDNLKKSAYASKQDGLVIETLW